MPVEGPSPTKMTPSDSLSSGSLSITTASSTLFAGSQNFFFIFEGSWDRERKAQKI